MGLKDEIMLRLGAYKNRAKLNYLLTTGRWTTYYCSFADENTLCLPKIRMREKESKLPKTVKITSKPCFNETSKIYEYHAIEGIPGTINWFGKTANPSDKEDRRMITAAIELGERIGKGERIGFDLLSILKDYANFLPIALIALQIATIIGIYVLLTA